MRLKVLVKLGKRGIKYMEIVYLWLSREKSRVEKDINRRFQGKGLLLCKLILWVWQFRKHESHRLFDFSYILVYNCMYTLSWTRSTQRSVYMYLVNTVFQFYKALVLVLYTHIDTSCILIQLSSYLTYTLYTIIFATIIYC